MCDYHPQRNWGKVMFLQVSVILLTGGCLPQCMLGYTTPPRSRHPADQTPPRSDTPRADIPPGADTPPEQTPPLEQTLAWSRHTPLKQTPPPLEQTPPRADTLLLQSMLGDMVNARVARILLECNLVKL